MPDQPPQSEAVAALERAFDEAVESGWPRIVVLCGETGRGKTYAIQRFFEVLARRHPGYWDPRLAPTWPPTLLTDMDQDRKRVVPDVADSSSEPGFWWFAMSGSLIKLAGHDPTALFAQQVHDQFENALRAAVRAERLTKESLDLLLEVIFFLIGLLPGGSVAGNIKTMLDKSRSFAQAAATDRTTAREAMYRALSQVSSRIGPRPVVAVIDDASGASVETLSLAAGLTAPDADHSWISDLLESDPGEEHIYFPLTPQTPPPTPVLYVLSLWDQRTSSALDDPVHRWLREAEGLGLGIVTVECDELTPTEAADLLEHVEGLAPEQRSAVLSHVTHRTARSKLVNPLTLATVAGTLAEHRSKFGEISLTDEDVAHLPDVPEQRVRDRLGQLTSADRGGEAVAMLHLLSHLGQRVPLAAVRFAADQFQTWDGDRLVSEMARHGMFSPPEMPEHEMIPATATGEIDADVYRYLAGNRLERISQAALQRACAAGLTWLVESGMTHAPDSLRSGPSVYANYRSLARALTIDAGPDATLVAAALLDQVRQRFPDKPAASVAALCLGYVGGSTWSLTEDEIVAAADQLGACWLVAQVLIRRIRSGKQLGASLAERIDAVLTVVAPHDELTAHALASYFHSSGRDDDALRTLVAFDHHPQTIELMARIELGRGQAAAAEKLLRRGSAKNAHNAIVLASLLSERGELDLAISLLESFRGNAHAVIKTAQIHQLGGREDVAEQVLRDARAQSPTVAFEYARMLASRGADREAIEVLAPHADQQHVVHRMVELSERMGDVLLAETLLRSASQRSVSGVVELAEFLDRHGRDDDAREALLPAAEHHAAAAVALAKLFDRADNASQAESWFSHAAELDPERVLELSAYLIRSDRSFEALAALASLLEVSQDVIVRYARLSIDCGRSDEAVRRLSALDSLGRNSAMVVAKLLGRTNPGGAADVLRPWMRIEPGIADHMFTWYLIAGRTDMAKSVLPYTTRNPGSLGDDLALDLVENRLDDSARRYRGVRPIHRRKALFRLFVILTTMGRFDLVREFLVRAGGSLPHEVAASTILSRRDDMVDSDDAIARALETVWPTLADRHILVAALREPLQQWRLSRISPSLRDPLIKPIGVLSMVEVVERLRLPIPCQLVDGVSAELAMLARIDPRVYQAFHTRRETSHVAAVILDTIEPPSSWRPAQQADALDD